MMKIIHELIKDEYFEKEVLEPKVRQTVRGIVVDENNCVALIHIKGLDRFGYRDHYELPGGGIEEGEDPIEAMKREMHEEIGYEISDITYIGSISNEYNVLRRIDNQNFYFAKAQKFVGQDLVDYEKDLFTEVVFVPVCEFKEFYASHPVEGIGSMIHKMDLFALSYCFKL